MRVRRLGFLGGRGLAMEEAEEERGFLKPFSKVSSFLFSFSERERELTERARELRVEAEGEVGRLGSMSGTLVVDDQAMLKGWFIQKDTVGR